MRYRVAVLLLFAFVSGCSGADGKRFSIRFQPFSADLDEQAQETVRRAAVVAKAGPLRPISLQGYTTRPDAVGFPTLREQRVAVVLRALTREGVGRWRIQVLGDGILYPRGVTMPPLPPEQVDINIGL